MKTNEIVEYKETILEIRKCGGDYLVVLSDKEKGYCILSCPVKLEKDNATFDEVMHAFDVMLGKALYG